MAAIAQLQVPADAFGTPDFAITDWTHAAVYLASTSSATIRSYSASPITQTPIVSAYLNSGHAGYAFVGDADPVTGAVIVQTNGAGVVNADPIARFDPATLAQTGTFGASTSFPSYPGSVRIGESLVCVGVGTLASGGAVRVGYALLKESEFSGYVAVIRTDTMTHAGAYLSVVSGAVNNRAIMCRGAGGRTGGSAFLTWNGSINGQSASVPLYKVSILPGAETYNPAAWPTTNPYITSATVGTIAAASVDPAWTTLQADAIGYDAADGNVLIDVTTGTVDVTHNRYIAKINGATAAVIWATPVSDVVTPQAGRINARLPMVRSGSFDALNLATGADTSTTYNGVTPSYVAGDSIARVMLLHTSFVEGAGSPTPVSGTPSSFTGWAIADWPDRADPDFPLVGVSKVLLPTAELQFLDANGHPYAGGSLETLIPSTDTPKDTWSDPAGAALNDNPITLDSAGRCIVFGDGAYRTILRDALGNLIWDKPSFTYVSAAMTPVVGAPTIAAAVVLLGITDTVDAAVAAEAAIRAAADTAEATARAAGDAALAAEDAILAAAIAAETAARIAAIGGLPGTPTVDVLLRRGTTTSSGAGAVSITFSPAFPLYCMTFGLDLSTFDNTGGYQLVGETVTASTVTFTFTLGDGTTPRAATTFNYWATGY